MKPYPVHSDKTKRLLGPAVKKSCAYYIQYLRDDSPIVSTSHYVLHDLYMTYGQDLVDAECDRQFKRKA